MPLNAASDGRTATPTSIALCAVFSITDAVFPPCRDPHHPPSFGPSDQKRVRYTIPPFQRPYVWSQDDQWEPLWETRPV